MTARNGWRECTAREIAHAYASGMDIRPNSVLYTRDGYRYRSVTELHADLIAGCRTLGQLSDHWNETDYIDPADLADVDRLLIGLHAALIAIRAGGAA